jgi:hypothetical protein
MRRALAFLLAVTLVAAFPAAAQPSGVGAPNGAESSSSGMDCCGGAPPAVDCKFAGCVGLGAVLLFASPHRAFASPMSQTPETFLARPVALPGRAPDTAPPKPAV